MTDQSNLSPSEAKTAMAELDQELNRLQRAIRLAIQAQLSKMAGRSMGDLEQNRHLAESIHGLLESHGLRVRCSECGHPAILNPNSGRTSSKKTGIGSVDDPRHQVSGAQAREGEKEQSPVHPQNRVLERC